MRGINNNAITSRKKNHSKYKKKFYITICAVPFVRISDIASRLFVKLLNCEILHYSNLEQQNDRNNNNVN